MNCNNNLASVLQKIGRSSEALKLFNKVFQTFEQIAKDENGDEDKKNFHPDVASVLHNIAVVHHTLGNFAAGKEYYLKSIEILKKFFGEENARVAEIFCNLATMYRFDKRYDEALETFNNAKKIYFKVYGDRHDTIASIYTQMAKIYETQGKRDQAMLAYKKSLTVYNKLYKDEHIEVAVCL